MPHHFQGKKRFKKREFFVPHQIWQNKWFEKREFFARQHLAPRRRFKKLYVFRTLAGKWFLERMFPVPQHLAELYAYGSTEWFLKRTFFVPQDSEWFNKINIFRTIRSTTNDEPKSGQNGS